jgi:hypothetical protein
MGRTDEFNAFRIANPSSPIDFSKATLDGVNLPGVDLHGAKLMGASLKGADLSGANLSGANLSLARLARANLKTADLTGAILIGADLRRALLDGARIEDADFAHADLSEAILPKGVTAKTLKGLASRVASPLDKDIQVSEVCHVCRQASSLPMTCPDARWAPVRCQKWLQSEEDLSGLLGRLALERKYIKSIPQEEFDSFMKEATHHLLLLRWMNPSQLPATQEECLALYTEVLSKFLAL